MRLRSRRPYHLPITPFLVTVLKRRALLAHRLRINWNVHLGMRCYRGLLSLLFLDPIPHVRPERERRSRREVLRCALLSFSMWTGF